MTETACYTAVSDRNYKDRLFRMIFSNKKELLELYNAANGTHYDNPELLKINTLENAIYLSMRNDISFIIESRIMLYEHQSTYNPNLPLRYLFYIADLYSSITRGMNLYGPKRLQLPTPRFIIFYNGSEEQPDRQELRLSELFEIPEDDYWLELKAVMLNINSGRNRKLLKNSRTLRDYSAYVSKVREYAKTMELEAAVERAITECIDAGILREFLSRNRSEAKKVSIYEYDEEKVMRDMKEAYKEIYKEEGLQEGQALKLISQVRRKAVKGQSPARIAEDLLEESALVEEIFRLIQSHPKAQTRELYRLWKEP